MNPFKVSAQFAAYVWFTQRKEKASREATRFAKDNWIAFLPYADKNLGMAAEALPAGFPRSESYNDHIINRL